MVQYLFTTVIITRKELIYPIPVAMPRFSRITQNMGNGPMYTKGGTMIHCEECLHCKSRDVDVTLMLDRLPRILIFYECRYDPKWISVEKEHYCSHGVERVNLDDVKATIHAFLEAIRYGNEVTE
jgi:hypothetical protein